MAHSDHVPIPAPITAAKEIRYRLARPEPYVPPTLPAAEGPTQTIWAGNGEEGVTPRKIRIQLPEEN